ncbi:MAG TPA: phage baseplate assembly protein V [Rugosimonospora sp.]|nr:phage baseplate assembly protein V [Rugosimonospora sp.]
MTAVAVPAVELTLAGTPLPATVRVVAVRVAARFNAPTQCEVTLEPELPAGATIGAPLQVRVAGERAVLFDGDVTCVELSQTTAGTSTARLRGYDRVHRLRSRQTLRVFENVSATELARILAGEVDGPDTPTFARVVQHRQSDFELLVETAARGGYLVASHGAELRLTTLAGDGEPVPLRFGDTLLACGVEGNADRAARRVTALGWDADLAAPLRAQASGARSGRRSGLAVPDGGELSLVAQAGTELAGTAQLALDLRVAGEVVLRGTATGDGRLRPGTPVTVDGAGSIADGTHVVTEVVHQLDRDGYTSTFTTQPPDLPRPAAGCAITLGQVTAVDDPDRRGRVRVSLPALGGADAGWLGVLCPGAGRDKGLVALPGVDDTVAVALPHGDPGAGLVLGSLYGAIAPPDPGIWSLRTPGGQTVVLDDSAHTLRLSNKDGSAVELAPDKVRLTAVTDLVIDAAGHGLTIRAATVDFQNA